MTLSSFISSIYPCYENGLDSIYGGFYLFSMFIMSILYISRGQNRRRIKLFFGVKSKVDADQIIRERTPYKRRIIFHNVIYHVLPILNTIFVFLYIPYKVCWQTRLWTTFLLFGPGLAIPMGLHRLYSHRAFKATRLYQIVIMLLSCMLNQDSIIYWARDHRAHHKFIDTDADPYNAKRGLFFSHMGFWMVEKHPDVIRKGRTIDISDLTSNPILVFQRKYLHILQPLFHFILPWVVPHLLWGDRFWSCYFYCVDFPYVCLTLGLTGFVNSWSHYDGKRPYNKNITASDGCIIRNVFLFGEGYHNFHHTFPRDYRSNEFQSWTSISSNLIYGLSRIGLTSDLRTTPDEIVKKRRESIKVGVD